MNEECPYCHGKGYKVVPGVWITQKTLEEKYGIKERPKGGKTFYFCLCDLGEEMEKRFMRKEIAVDVGGLEVWFE